MKHFTILFLITFFGGLTLLGQNTTNILNGTTLLYTLPSHVDTLKDPSGTKLSKKLKKRQGQAVQKRDISLSKEKKEADKIYEALGYMAAAERYENLKGIERNRFVLAKLANSYRLNGQTEDAEYCYAQIVQNTDNPEDILHYAQVLQSNGKCEDAVRWYKEYQAKSFDRSRDFILDCEMLEDFKESDVDLENLTELNTENLDFSPIPYNDGIIFTSNRGTNDLTKRQDKWTNGNFSDLFFSKKADNGGFQETVPLEGDINGKFHDGVPTFNRAGTLMIFTRTNKKGKSKNGNRLLKLYVAENLGNYWTNVEELPINSDDFSNCHPTLSPDGRKLYFSSDREEDGFGGMDIYVSENVGGSWQKPINLGPTVNSPGNEVFPFLAEDGTLYFSSNGHLGIGGLDIFSVKKGIEDNENTWNIRENLGRPFNSPKDDFGFVINKDQKSGYLTSSRIGGKGGDDIYEWEGEIKSKNENTLERKICVYDPSSGNRIEDVSVTILGTSESGEFQLGERDLLLRLKPLDSNNQEYVLSIIEKNNKGLTGSNQYTTDSKGTFRYVPIPQNDYIFVLEKAGYHTTRKTVKSAELLKGNEFCIPIEKRNCLTLDGRVKNKKYQTFIPDAEVKIFNKCTGEIDVVFSDAQGAFEACLDCGCEYDIYASKPFFESEMTIVTTENQDCEDLESQPALVASIDMTVNENPDLANYNNSNSPNYNGNRAPYNTPGWSNPNNPNVVYVPVPSNGKPLNPSDLNRYFLGDENARFEEGQLIKLSNIYYDFDEFYIRGDAAKELDHVYNLLKAYPTMEIALLAHTDSRGSDRYNDRLSRKRAKAAVQYLIDRGISPSRLVPMGLGETRLSNACEDGVNCEEEDHQTNRRTEVRILKLNEPGVRVEYNK